MMENVETIQEALSQWHVSEITYDQNKETRRTKLIYVETPGPVTGASSSFDICSIEDMFDERRFPGFLEYSLSSYSKPSDDNVVVVRSSTNAYMNNAKPTEENEQSDHHTKSLSVQQCLQESDGSTDQPQPGATGSNSEYDSQRLNSRKDQDDGQ